MTPSFRSNRIGDQDKNRSRQTTSRRPGPRFLASRMETSRDKRYQEVYEAFD